MSNKTAIQKKARALQERTGWSYSECLRCYVNQMSYDAIENLIKIRASENQSKN